MNEQKELWVKFACAALTGLLSVPDNDLDAEDASCLAEEYADYMLNVFNKKEF